MWIWWILGGLFVIFGGMVLAFWLMKRYLQAEYQNARQQFDQQRDALKQQYFQVAAASGKPRGLLWKEIHWTPLAEFVRNRKNGQIGAFVGVTIQFEAVAGSDMEDVPAVKDSKNASAFFVFEQGQWHVTNKTFFNMNPDEAIQHFEEQFERMEK